LRKSTWALFRQVRPGLATRPGPVRVPPQPAARGRGARPPERRRRATRRRYGFRRARELRPAGWTAGRPRRQALGRLRLAAGLGAQSRRAAPERDLPRRRFRLWPGRPERRPAGRSGRRQPRREQGRGRPGRRLRRGGQLRADRVVLSRRAFALPGVRAARRRGGQLRRRRRVAQAVPGGPGGAEYRAAAGRARTRPPRRSELPLTGLRRRSRAGSGRRPLAERRDRGAGRARDGRVGRTGPARTGPVKMRRRAGAASRGGRLGIPAASRRADRPAVRPARPTVSCPGPPKTRLRARSGAVRSGGGSS